MHRYISLLLAHRFMVLLVCGLVTVLAVAMLTQAVVASSIVKLFLGESPEYQRYLENVRDHASDEVIVVGIEEGELLSPDALDRLEAAVHAISALSEVRRVTSIIDLPRFARDEYGSLTVSTYAAAARVAPADSSQLAVDLRREPLGGGLLVSTDGDAHAVVVELAHDPGRPEELTPDILAQVLDAFTTVGYAPADLHATGLVPAVSAIFSITYDTLQRILPIIAFVLLGTMLVLFRRPWPLLVAAIVSVTGVLWTMGIAVCLDPNVNVLLAMVPAVILIVSFSDVVHLCSAYLIELEEGLEKRDAILAAGSDVGRACLWTSITTFVGFVAMSMVPTPVFRMFGMVLGFGVGATLLLALTLVPILLDLLPRPRLLHQGTTGGALVNRMLDSAMRWMEGLAMRRAPWVIAGWAILTVLSLFGITHIHVETDLAARLATDHPLRVDQRWSEERFAGANLMELVLQADPQALLDPDLIRTIARFRDTLEDLPGVDATVSILDIAESANATLQEIDEPVSLADLDDADLGRLELRLASLGFARRGPLGGAAASAGQLGSSSDFERGRLHLTMRLADEGFRASAAIGRAARETAERVLGDVASVEVSGIVFLLGSWLDEIVDAQRRSLIWTILIIALMMVLGLRSLRAGLFSMAPNLLPLIVVGGYMGLAWGEVDSDAFLIGLLAIGIGVDDTIHFMTRYRLEIARDDDVPAAVRRTFAFAGRGIVMTTIILALGFLPLATSAYFTVSMFGTMLPLCLVIALLADLLLIPAMVRVGWIRFR